jgi:hypothetical protein
MELRCDNVGLPHGALLAELEAAEQRRRTLLLGETATEAECAAAEVRGAAGRSCHNLISHHLSSHLSVQREYCHNITSHIISSSSKGSVAIISSLISSHLVSLSPEGMLPYSHLLSHLSTKAVLP